MRRSELKRTDRYSHLKVRLPREELDSFQAFAELSGMTLSAWVRLILRAEVKEQQRSERVI